MTKPVLVAVLSLLVTACAGWPALDTGRAGTADGGDGRDQPERAVEQSREATDRNAQQLVSSLRAPLPSTTQLLMTQHRLCQRPAAERQSALSGLSTADGGDDQPPVTALQQLMLRLCGEAPDSVPDALWSRLLDWSHWPPGYAAWLAILQRHDEQLSRLRAEKQRIRAHMEQKIEKLTEIEEQLNQRNQPTPAE